MPLVKENTMLSFVANFSGSFYCSTRVLEGCHKYLALGVSPDNYYEIKKKNWFKIKVS